MASDKERIGMVCEVSELVGLFEKSESLEEILPTVVSTIAYHMKAAVCSLYIYDPKREELIMRANQGLNEAVGQVRLRLGEGITGLAVKELRPIRVGRLHGHSHNKYFPGIGEEQYQAFLAVPLLKGLERIGALVVQDPQPDYFTHEDETALRSIAAQLATTIHTANLLMALRQKPEVGATGMDPASEPIFIKGSAGIGKYAMGEVIVLEQGAYEVLLSADDEDDPDTLEDFQEAIRITELQLETLEKHLEENLADVASLIFNAHLLILKDDGFSGEMERRIKDGVAPQRAISAVVNDYIHVLAASKSKQHRDMVHDVKDLGHRLLHNLTDDTDEHVNYDDRILVVEDILPSELLKFVAQRMEGLVITRGTVTSHIAVLSRSLQVPVVFADTRRLLDLAEGTPMIIDGQQATIFVHPSEEVADRYQSLIEDERQAREQQVDVAETTWTSDKERITLQANINLLSDLVTARRNRAEGVGLYRSEFPFIVRANFPSEVEQLNIYRRIVSEMNGREVTFRTLDIGGDKALPYQDSNEANPFLGLRAIRFSLKNEMIFCQQLRAMLRAGATRIMFPFISSLDDFLRARIIVHQCLDRLKEENGPPDDFHMPKLGAMVELPAAVEIVKALAEECDFLCLGTNDLIQYLLAADRTNENVRDYYIPYHPAVLRAIKKVARAADSQGIDLSLCGDLAMDETMLPFLLGVNIRKLSIEPRAIPRIQKVIEGMKMSDCVEAAKTMLKFKKVSDVRAYIEAGNKC